MLEFFRVSKGHSLIRNGKSAKGFRGVKLKRLQFGTLGTDILNSLRTREKNMETDKKYISTKDSEKSVPSVPKPTNLSSGDAEEIPEILTGGRIEI